MSDDAGSVEMTCPGCGEVVSSPLVSEHRLSENGDLTITMFASAQPLRDHVAECTDADPEPPQPLP